MELIQCELAQRCSPNAKCKFRHTIRIDHINDRFLKGLFDRRKAVYGKGWLQVGCYDPASIDESILAHTYDTEPSETLKIKEIV